MNLYLVQGPHVASRLILGGELVISNEDFEEVDGRLVALAPMGKGLTDHGIRLLGVSAKYMGIY